MRADDRSALLEFVSALRRPEWHARAACRGRDDVDWFPERGESLEPAKAVCAACPVLEECCDFAVTNGEKHGVWAGMSALDRRQLRRQRRQPAA